MASAIRFFPAILLCLAPCLTASAEAADFSLGIGGGAYRPREYRQEFHIRDHFGTNGTPEGRIEAGWVIHRLVSLEASAGYFEATKTYITTATTTAGEPFTQGGNYTLMVIPVDLSLIFRADFFSGQLVIPYLGLGMDEFYFSQQGKDRVWGWKWGSHALGGLRIFLNPLDPRHTGNLRAEYGIKGVYLDLQAKYAVVYRHHNGSSEGFDLSGWFFTGSFLFEF